MTVPSPGAPVVAASHVTLSGAGFGQPPRFDFATRCRAAADAGLDGLGLHLADPVLADGQTGLDTVARALDAAGLRLLEIELLTGWARGTADDAQVDLLLELAERFRPHHVTAVEFGPEPVEVDVAIRSLGPLAARFADLGVAVAVESFPWSGLRDVDTLVAILDAVASPSVGAMVDVWHLHHCVAPGRHDDVLSRATAVQLNDGEPATGDLLTAARTARLLPGEGVFDVRRLVAGLRESGYAGPWCVEASDPVIRAARVDDTAARVWRSARTVLD